jgi:hypothetical protein
MFRFSNGRAGRRSGRGQRATMARTIPHSVCCSVQLNLAGGAGIEKSKPSPKNAAVSNFPKTSREKIWAEKFDKNARWRDVLAAK